MHSLLLSRPLLALLLLAVAATSLLGHPLPSSPTQPHDGQVPSTGADGKQVSGGGIGQYATLGFGILSTGAAVVMGVQNHRLREKNQGLKLELGTAANEYNTLKLSNKELDRYATELWTSNRIKDEQVKVKGASLAEAQQQIARLKHLAGQQPDWALATNQVDAKARKARGDSAFEQVLQAMRTNPDFADCVYERLRTDSVISSHQGWLHTDSTLERLVRDCLMRARLPFTTIPLTRYDFPDGYYDVPAGPVREAWRDAHESRRAQKAAPGQPDGQQQFRAFAASAPSTPLPVSGRSAMRPQQLQRARGFLPAIFRASAGANRASRSSNSGGRSVADGLLAMWSRRKPLDATQLARTAAASMSTASGAGGSNAAKTPASYPGVVHLMQGSGSSSGRGMMLRKPG